MDYIKAFLIGGLICAAVQILLDRTKLMPGRVMVLLVCTGAVLGFIGVYEPFVKFAGAGASVPLLGFGNVLWKGVKEAVDKNGFLGIFLGGFKASAAGISAALIFGYLASLIFDLIVCDAPAHQAYHGRFHVSYCLEQFLKRHADGNNECKGERNDRIADAKYNDRFG